MPYVDSNIFLYPILYDSKADPKVEKAKQILIEIEKGTLHACTSTLTWDEIIWVTSKIMGKTEGTNQGQRFLGFPNIDFIMVDMNILNQAQNILGKHNLKPRDAIDIASALQRKEKTLISDDKDFDKIREIKRIPIEQF